MNRNEFQTEIHEYIDKQFDQFYKFQDIVNEIYVQLTTIASKHEIPLFIAFGSMLGIVRDSCFLPWDRDIDTFVLYKDAFNLINALQQELPDDYYIVSNLIDNKYRAPMTRVCKKGYNSNAIHVDIFYAFNISDDEQQQKRQLKKAKKIFALHVLKNDICKRKYYTSQLSYYYGLFKTLKGKMTPRFFIDYRLKKLVEKHPDSNTLLILAGEATRIIDKRDVFPGKSIEINGVTYLLCENYKNVLKRLYGDYMKYMDVSDRFKEFYSGICYLDKEAIE